MFDPLTFEILIFGAAAVAITIAGTRLSRIADQLADQTGLGEAIMGTLFLAGATSLPDFAATLNAASDGRAELAMGNVNHSVERGSLMKAIEWLRPSVRFVDRFLRPRA